MGEAALRRVAQLFTLPQQARRTVEVYARAVMRGKRP
jgi:hypothetical protein